MSIRAPQLFPEFHTPSTSKFIIDWTTFDAWNYNIIKECELDAAVINGNYLVILGYTWFVHAKRATCVAM